MSKYFQKLRNGLFLITLFAKQKVRSVRKQPIIHIIGDSHALLFQHELFKIHYIGPATAFNLFSPKSSNNSKEKIVSILETLKKMHQPYVMFVLGEIDCRIHIYKTHKEKNIPLSDAIDQTAQRYISHILELKKLYPHFNFMLFNILPPGEQENFYNYSHYADRHTRLEITQKLNEKLQDLTSHHHIHFIQAYDELIDAHKNRLKDLIFDDIHYSNKIIPIVIQKIWQKNLFRS